MSVRQWEEIQALLWRQGVGGRVLILAGRYSGPVANGDEWGYTVVDHRSNPRHPTYWHVRGYGLFTANPFGVHHFKNDASVDGSLELPGGETATFRYRIIIHPGRGPAASPRIGELIEAFQAAP